MTGRLDLLLLAVLADESAHGYSIIEELKRRSGGAFDLPEGTVYPALHRLERDGSISSSWDSSTGRKRRVYTLTRRGRAALERETDGWRRFSSAVSAVVES